MIHDADDALTSTINIMNTTPTHQALKQSTNYQEIQSRRPLDAIFTAKSIAVIGASESPHSVGRTLMENLMHGCSGGEVFPINPNRVSILGAKAYHSVLDVPVALDLAVIATRAAIVPEVVRHCAQAQLPGAIIISAGFKELGADGAALERQILETTRKSKMRIIGPNCLGVMMPHTGLNATFGGAMARSGNVAFLSQSGALGTAILDWSQREQFGFSAFVSVGSMLDVGWGI